MQSNNTEFIHTTTIMMKNARHWLYKIFDIQTSKRKLNTSIHTKGKVSSIPDTGSLLNI
jgi:hypothetical protein